MKPGIQIREWIAAALLAVGVAVFISSLQVTQTPGDTSGAARRVERTLGRRLALLDGYIGQALAQDPAQWMDLGELPQDFVVYRYCSDTLQSWSHEFPISNDNISRRLYVPFLADSRLSAVSPLTVITDSLGFYNFGSRWYLAKAAGDESVRVIAALEVMDEMRGPGPARGLRRVNEHLRLSPKYTIRPLSYSGGTAVTLEGRPQFKILMESMAPGGRDSMPLIWVSLALCLVALLVFLSADRSLRRFRWVAAGVLVLMTGLYFWGKFSQGRSMIFSPRLYAGGELLYSLGAVVLINLAILVLSLCAYMVRAAIAERMEDRGSRIAACAVVLLSVAGIVVYSRLALGSIIFNSGISMEIYKLAQLSPFTIVVYVSFITLLLSIPLQLQLLAPVLNRQGRHSFDALSLTNRVVFSGLVGVYLIVVAAVLGFSKE